MGRLRQRARLLAEEEKHKDDRGYWPDLCRRIERGQVIPIVSNTIFYDQIFDFDGDGILGISPDETNPKNWSIEEQLADIYGEKIRFPMDERNRLSLVTLFDRVFTGPDDPAAKTRFNDWLKEALLILAEDDPNVLPEGIDEMKDEIKQKSFSDIATHLGYPRPNEGEANVLEYLAKLKLPIYITTSPFNFLERAIENDQTKPRTQVCFWSGSPLHFSDESHKTDHTFEPTPQNPLVYHLFGLEDYPKSVVMTEDNFLDFLAAISRDSGQKEPILPLYLRSALTESSLILLGYRLRDWDFRVMFRGLINATPPSLRGFSLAIQLDPTKQGRVVSAAQIKDYLDNYFGTSNFTVEWASSVGFMERLWEEWQQWRS